MWIACFISTGVNDATGIAEKLSYSTVDTLFETLREMTQLTTVFRYILDASFAADHVCVFQRIRFPFSKLTSIQRIVAFPYGQARHSSIGCTVVVRFKCVQGTTGDRRFANIMFVFDGAVHCSKHLAMPFGAVASVHAWHRIGMFSLAR